MKWSILLTVPTICLSLERRRISFLFMNFLKSDLENFDSLIDSGEESKIKTVWARPGRLSTLSVSHSKSFFVRRFCMGTQGA